MNQYPYAIRQGRFIHACYCRSCRTFRARHRMANRGTRLEQTVFVSTVLLAIVSIIGVVAGAIAQR